jgi:hypothetical protein
LAKRKNKDKQKLHTKSGQSSKSKHPVYAENKYYVWGLFAVFAIFVFLASTFKITGDDDFFWHLATGRYIVEHKVVPDTDVFGFATQGVEWIPFEWGWDVLTYGLYNIAGYNTILVFRSLAFVFIFFLYFLLLRKFKVNTFIIWLVLFTLLVAVIDRLSPRPHVITYIFFITVIYILTSFKYFDRDKYAKKLYFLPLIFFIWCNMHMGVMAGGLFLFVFTVSELIIYFYPRKFSTNEIKPLSQAHLKILLIVSVLSALALLVNPHGIHTYIYAYDHTKMKMLETVNEWRSPFDTMYGSFVTTLYKVFLFGGLLILIYAYIKKDLFFALIYVVLFFYSIRAIRFTVDYELLITFFLAITLNYFMLRMGNSNIWKSTVNYLGYNNSVKVILALFTLYICFQIPNNNIYGTLKYYRVFGWGINDEFIPVQLFNFMKENNIKGTPFNQFGTGGYLVWNFPDQKNFIDSRNLNDRIFNEYNSIMVKAPGFEKKMEKYGFDYVIYLDPDLIRRQNEMKQIIVSYLSTNPEWKLVFWDDKSFLFLKNIPKFSDVIKKYEYKILNPYIAIFNTQEFSKNIVNNPERAKEELKRKAEAEPNGYIYRGMDAIAKKLLPGLQN